MRELQWFSSLLFVLFTSNFGVSYKFDKNYFGVTLLPFVKQVEKESFPGFDTYTFDNIKTMLKVIAGKFSKFHVQAHFAQTDTYIKNATYNTSSLVTVRSAEAAAQINQESGRKLLSCSIYLHPTPSVHVSIYEVDIKLSFESAEKANSIFPGTVENIIFECVEGLSNEKQTLDYLKLYRKKASQLGFNLGIGRNCVYPQGNGTLKENGKQLVENSDVILIGIKHETRASDPKSSFDYTARSFVKFKKFIIKFNRDIQVVGWTDWSSSGRETGETVASLGTFWETANTWAVTNKYTIYLHEAFDNPWREGDSEREAHCGWWKLEKNSDINSMDGYVEKISKSGYKTENTSTSQYWISATIALGAVLILIGIAFVFWLVRAKKSASLTKNEIRDFILGTSSSLGEIQWSSSLLETALNGPYDATLEISRKNLKIDNSHLLGKGTFGCVFKATITKNEMESTEVAVKVANEKCPSDALKGLLSEIKIMSYLGKHGNIVALQGAYTAELTTGVVFVCTELCTLGSLESYLRKNHSSGNADEISEENGGEEVELESKITFQDRMQWSHEISSGMEFLESKHVVHADLATRNVLLTAEKTAKITDFGLSRRMYNYVNYVKTHQEPLPWRWMAIESLKKMEFSSKSDVWSYGVTLWEIFSNGEVPYQGLSWSADFSSDLLHGLRPGRPKLASPEIYKLVQKCWTLEPNERPSFRELTRYTNNLTHGCVDTNSKIYLTLRE